MAAEIELVLGMEACFDLSYTVLSEILVSQKINALISGANIFSIWGLRKFFSPRNFNIADAIYKASVLGFWFTVYSRPKIAN